MNFIVHPDYILEERERTVYEALLGHLKVLEQRDDVWLALPRDVDRWWRERSQMKLVKSGSGWQIKGQGRERARIAYATEENGRLVYKFDEHARHGQLATMARALATEMYDRKVPAT